MTKNRLFQPTIRSVETDQTEILKGILHLEGLDYFDFDCTYGNGSFYKDIPQPTHRSDKDNDLNVGIGDSTNMAFPDNSLRSIVYDPPFLTYIKEGREHGSIMGQRFGGYWSYTELEADYQATLAEAKRCLEPSGVLVFKCQDIVHNHRLHATHINVVQWAANVGLRLKDLYVLAKDHRIPMPEGDTPRQQRHARIHHSYFLVLSNE